MIAFLKTLDWFLNSIALKFLTPILVGLLLWGVASASSVWWVVLLVLLRITTDGILRLQPVPEAYIDFPQDGSSESKLVPAPPEVKRDTVLRIVAWWIALPAILFTGWAWFEPVVGWYGSFRLPSALVAATGVLLLWWPDRWRLLLTPTRTAFRTTIAVFIVAIAVASLVLRHPYLIPGNPDAVRIKAERVLSAGNIVIVQRHADSLVKRAVELEQGGSFSQADQLFDLATRADNTNANHMLAYADFLKRHDMPAKEAIYRKLAVSVRDEKLPDDFSRPYALDHFEPLPLIAPVRNSAHRIVLVACNETPPELLDRLGFVIRSELNVVTLRLPQAVRLDGESRRSGMLARQISIDDAWKQIVTQLPPYLHPPTQLLVITSRDLFAPGANYLYSSPTVPGCGIISYARLGNTKHPCSDSALLDSLCKQAISTTIKSVLIYPSPDRRDVTAYVNGPFQLSRKGRRPLPATVASYRAGIRLWETLLETRTGG